MNTVPEDTPPSREERLAGLAEKLCHAYTYGVGIDEMAATNPEEAEVHRDAAEAILPLLEEAPREDRRAAFRRGWDRGRDAERQRNTEHVARLEAELADLRQDRDPDGLRARIRDLEHTLRGWDQLMNNRRYTGWEKVAAHYLELLTEVQRELAELKGHQPSDAGLVVLPHQAVDHFFQAQQDVDRLRTENGTSWTIVNAVWSRFRAMAADRQEQP